MGGSLQTTSSGVGVNKFYPIILNWRMHPERDERWYQFTRTTLGAKRTAQEVDCDFLQSGYNVFDTSHLVAIEARLVEFQFKPIGRTAPRSTI